MENSLVFFVLRGHESRSYHFMSPELIWWEEQIDSVILNKVSKWFWKLLDPGFQFPHY